MSGDVVVSSSTDTQEAVNEAAKYGGRRAPSARVEHLRDTSESAKDESDAESEPAETEEPEAEPPEKAEPEEEEEPEA